MKVSTRRSTVSKAKKLAPVKTKPPVMRTASLDKAIKGYEEALKVFARQEYTKAAHLFEGLIKEYRTEREVCDRSRTYLSVCKSHTAAAPPKPKTADDFYYQGVVAANDGRLQEAAELFDKAVKQDPRSDKSHYALASVYCQMNEKSRALASLGKAIELHAGNKVSALNDAEFDPMRDDVEFMNLTGRRPEGNV